MLGLMLTLRSKRKVALITGITGASLASPGTADSVTGQDGSYLTELLLEKGYTVHGIIRRSSSFNTGRIEHLYKDVHERPRMVLHYGDLTVRAQARTTLRPQDTTNLVSIVAQVQPSEIYNLAAQSHVKVSFDMAEYTGDVDGLGSASMRGARSADSPSASSARRHSDLRPHSPRSLLPGVHFGAVRQGPGGSASLCSVGR